MLEHEIPNNEAGILRIALDIADHRDVIRNLLSMAHMELEVEQIKRAEDSKSDLLEIRRLDTLVWQAADECAALGAELDDAEAGWARDVARLIATSQTLSDAAQSAITASGISINVNEGLLERIAELENDLSGERHFNRGLTEARVTELEAHLADAYQANDALRREIARFNATPFSVGLERKIAEQAREIARLEQSLEKLQIDSLDLDASLAEAQRQKVAAFERNSQLEKQVAATPYSVKLEAKIKDADTALCDVMNQQSDPALIRCLERVLVILRAPSVPRRDSAYPSQDVIGPETSL